MRVPNLLTSISQVAIYAPQTFRASRYIIVTRIDSIRKLHLAMTSIKEVANSTGVNFTALGDSLVIKREDFITIAKQSTLFNGFDEIWL